jgi:hypothetical protein
VDRLRRQWDEIERVQDTVRVRLLRGTESGILADGAPTTPTPSSATGHRHRSIHHRLADAAQMT